MVLVKWRTGWDQQHMLAYDHMTLKEICEHGKKFWFFLKEDNTRKIWGGVGIVGLNIVWLSSSYNITALVLVTMGNVSLNLWMKFDENSHLPNCGQYQKCQPWTALAEVHEYCISNNEYFTLANFLFFLVHQRYKTHQVWYLEHKKMLGYFIYVR